MKSSTSPIWHLFANSGGNNYAHAILTAEADSLSTDAKQLLEDYGLVGCHSSRRNDLSAHAKIDSSGHVRLPWESDDDKKGDMLQFLRSSLAKDR